MSRFYCRECGNSNDRLSCRDCGAVYSLTAQLLDAVKMQTRLANLGAALALAGLAATLVSYDDTAIERADYWAKRAGIEGAT